MKNHTFQGTIRANQIWSSFGDEVLVYFDPDVDGIISGYLACKFCAKHGKKFQWYINSNRSHDWSLPLESVSGKDVIAVDFIITFEKVMELCDAGVNLISMDHHKNGDVLIDYSSDYGTDGIVINNQYPFEEEDGRYLSGAGVVFETLISIDPEFDTLLNRQLVAITLLSDIREIENPLAEGYLYRLYSAKYDGFIRYLIDSTMGDRDFGFGLPKMDRNYVDYKFSPAINACLRFNHQEDAVNFMFKNDSLDLFWRDKQQELVRDLMSLIKVIELPHIKVCYFYESDVPLFHDVLSNFVGLTASKYLDGEKSVICYMINKEKTGIKRASFRGRINGLDYNMELNNAQLFRCLGHNSAFGIKEIIPTKDTFIKASKICGRVEENSGYERKIINVINMSMFVNSKAFLVAEDNMYKLTQNQTYIRYTGKNFTTHKRGANYTDWSLDGVLVKCFDVNLTPDKGLIMPILDRGMLTFYLE